MSSLGTDYELEVHMRQAFGRMLWKAAPTEEYRKQAVRQINWVCAVEGRSSLTGPLQWGGTTVNPSLKKRSFVLFLKGTLYLPTPTHMTKLRYAQRAIPREGLSSGVTVASDWTWECTAHSRVEAEALLARPCDLWGCSTAIAIYRVHPEELSNQITTSKSPMIPSSFK